MPDSNEIVLSLDIPSSEVIGSAENSEGTLESLSGTFREVGDQKLSEATSRFLEMVSDDNSLMVRLDTQSGEAFFSGLANSGDFADQIGGIIRNNVSRGIDQSSSIGRIIELLENSVDALSYTVSDEEDESGGTEQRTRTVAGRSSTARKRLNTGRASERSVGKTGQRAMDVKGLSSLLKDLEGLTEFFDDSEEIVSLRSTVESEMARTSDDELMDEMRKRATLAVNAQNGGRLDKNSKKWDQEFLDARDRLTQRLFDASKASIADAERQAEEQRKNGEYDEAFKEFRSALSDIGINTKTGALGGMNNVLGAATGGESSIEGILGGMLGSGGLSKVTGLLGRIALPIGAVTAGFKVFSDMRDQFNQMSDRGEVSGLEGAGAYGAAMSQDMNNWIQTTIYGHNQRVVNDANNKALEMGYQVGSLESNQVAGTLAALVSDKGISNAEATGLYKILVKAGSFNNQQLIQKVDELQNVIGQFGGANMEQAIKAYSSSVGEMSGLGYTSSGASDMAMSMSAGMVGAVGGTSFSGDEALTQSMLSGGGVSRYHAAALNPHIYEIAEQLVQNGTKAIPALLAGTVHYAADIAFNDKGGANFITDVLSGSDGMNGLLSVLGIAMGGGEDSTVEQEMATLEGLRSSESVAGSQEYRTFRGLMSSILGISIQSPEVAAKYIAWAWEVIYGITIQGAKGISYASAAQGAYMDINSIDLWSGGGYSAEGANMAGIQAASASGQSIVSPNYGGNWTGVSAGGNNVSSTVNVNVHDNTTDYNSSYIYHADSTRDANSTAMVNS